MLTGFKVTNFKNFKDELYLDLEHTNNYEFSGSAVKDGHVKTALIYGINGSGKTNLGKAVFDIILHMTDKEKNFSFYNIYKNLWNDDKEPTTFYYKFDFEGSILEYRYQKDGPQKLLNERVVIDGQEVVSYDFDSHEANVALSGTESLKLDLADKNISVIKYINNNAVLNDNSINKTFDKFISFVDNMLFFSSLERNHYQGFTNGAESISSGIVTAGKVLDFQRFLHKNKINYELAATKADQEDRISCKYGDKLVDFYSVASRGTCSLALLYYWLIKLDKTSLVFIDEFDAFYHSTLARSVVEEILNTKSVQAIFTTHNTDIMTSDLLRPDCYFALAGGQVKSFASLTDKELRKAHNLQKMYRAGAFDDNG